MAELNETDQHLINELPKVSEALKAEALIWSKDDKALETAANVLRMADNVDLAIRRIKALNRTKARLTKRLEAKNDKT